MRGGRCTNCGNQLERGFGLVNCLQCGTLLFIDLEGQVEKAEANQVRGLEQPDSPPPPPIQVSYDEPVDNNDLIQHFEQPLENDHGGAPGSAAPPKLKAKGQAQQAPPPVQGSKAPAPPPLKTKTNSSTKTRGEVETPSRTPAAIRQRLEATRVVRPGAEDGEASGIPPVRNLGEGFPAMDFEANSSQPEQASPLFQPLGAEGEMPSPLEESFEDGAGAVDFLKGRSPEGEGLDAIKNFGNSDLSQGQDGSLYFDVIISGVDSKKIRDELRDCLTDRRFLWDVDDLIKSIRKGELRLQGLSSVKTSVILSRLKELPVGLRWIQTGLTDLKQREPGV